MNALQLHQVTNATSASESPPKVRRLYCGANSSAMRGVALGGLNTSDSWRRRRISTATTAGTRPVRKTARHERLGLAAMSESLRVNKSLTKVAKNKPIGADVYKRAPPSTRRSKG